MRQIYTNENHVLAMNSRNTLEAAGIPVEFRNEFTSGAAVGGHAVWPELWVEDADYERALEALKDVPAIMAPAEWTCQTCLERNPGNFHACWKCQSNKGSPE